MIIGEFYGPPYEQALAINIKDIGLVVFVDDIYIISQPKKVEAKIFLGNRFFLINILDYRDIKEPFNIIVDAKLLSEYSNFLSSKIYTFEGEEEISLEKIDNKIVINIPYLKEHIASIVVKNE